MYFDIFWCQKSSNLWIQGEVFLRSGAKILKSMTLSTVYFYAILYSVLVIFQFCFCTLCMIHTCMIYNFQYCFWLELVKFLKYKLILRYSLCTLAENLPVVGPSYCNCASAILPFKHHHTVNGLCISIIDYCIFAQKKTMTDHDCFFAERSKLTLKH